MRKKKLLESLQFQLILVSNAIYRFNKKEIELKLTEDSDLFNRSQAFEAAPSLYINDLIEREFLLRDAINRLKFN